MTIFMPLVKNKMFRHVNGRSILRASLGLTASLLFPKFCEEKKKKKENQQGLSAQRTEEQLPRLQSVQLEKERESEKARDKDRESTRESMGVLNTCC